MHEFYSRLIGNLQLIIENHFYDIIYMVMVKFLIKKSLKTIEADLTSKKSIYNNLFLGEKSNYGKKNIKYKKHIGEFIGNDL